MKSTILKRVTALEVDQRKETTPVTCGWVPPNTPTKKLVEINRFGAWITFAERLPKAA